MQTSIATISPETRRRTLPVELYRPIAQNIADDTQALWGLLFTTPDLAAEAERLLYRCLRVEDATRQAKLYDRLATCPRVASLVRHITVYPPETPAADSPPICAALRAVTNLKSLTVNKELNDELATALGGGTFQLERFECQSVVCHPRLFRSFLLGQPALRSAKFDLFPLRVDAPPIMPNIAVLQTPFNYTLGSILPTRQVEYLITEPHSQPVSDNLVAPLARLRGCTLIRPEGSDPAFTPSMLGSIPNVEDLALIGYALEVAATLRAPAPPRKDAAPAPAPGLCVPRLRTLFVDLGDVAAPGPDVAAALAPLWAEIGTLERVEVMCAVVDAAGARGDASVLWERGAAPRRVERRAWAAPDAEDHF